MNSKPHRGKYYCTSCDDLLTAKSSTKKSEIQNHITNTDNAAHHGRRGNSPSAPITYTGTDSDVIEPIWKTAARSETEQLVYYALLRYPHLSISKNSQGSGDSTSISELLDLPKSEISRSLFRSPKITKLWIRRKYELVTDCSARELDKATLEPLERLLHRKVIKLARGKRGCSLEPDGSLNVPNISLEEVAESFNSDRFPNALPESTVADSNAVVSEQEVKNILSETVIEPRIPHHEHHAQTIVALHSCDTIREAGEKASEETGVEMSRSNVQAVKSRFPWKVYDVDALRDLKYSPTDVAIDFYDKIKETGLPIPDPIYQYHPDGEKLKVEREKEANGLTNVYEPDSSSESPQKTKADGGTEAEPVASPANPQVCLTLTNAPPKTIDHLSTVVETAIANIEGDSSEAAAAISIYEQLPKQARESILTSVRVDTSDEVFTALAARL